MIRTRRSTHLTRSRATLAVRRSVVVIQLALAMPLLIGGALLDRSLSSLRAEPLGFDARQVVSASVSLPRTRYADATAQSAVVERMLEGVRVLPGVEGAAAVSDLPLVGNHMAFEVTLEGRAGVGPKPTLGTRVVTASYFRTLAIPLRAGRLFAGTDDGQGEPVALLNESAARVLWPLASSIGAVGGRLRLGDEGGWLRVVGVVGDVHHMGVARGELPAIYLPLAQKPFDWLNWTTLVVRGGNAAESLRSVVRAVDPEVPVYDVQTLDELRDREFAPRLWLRRLLVAFAAISSFLVALGVYGVTSLYVTSRRRELGVRAALGASPWRAVALVVRQVATPAAAGAGVGLLIWLAVGRLLEAQFFRVDGARLEGVVLALAAVLAAVAAALVAPALRAWRAQPAALLRET